MKNSLEIKGLKAAINGTEILHGLNLTIPKGEVHAIMGKNGSGKSTLAKVMAGHPDYEVTGGDVLLDGKTILGLDPDVRAREGLFLAFQYPSEIPGVTIANFMRAALNARRPEGQEIDAEGEMAHFSSGACFGFAVEMEGGAGKGEEWGPVGFSVVP